MRHLFDTNACIALLNDTLPPLRERLHRLAPSDIGLPSPVAYGLYYSAYKSRHADRNLELLDRLEFEIVPFDPGMHARQARCAANLRRRDSRSVLTTC